MNFLQSKDERLLAFYENVRRQVELDNRSGGRYRLAGDGVKQYAEKLREEMDRRAPKGIAESANTKGNFDRDCN
jgi:hypothetical protein